MQGGKGAPPMPAEIGDAQLLTALGIPLAASPDGLGSVPARLVDEMLVLRAAGIEAQEWRELQAESAAKRRR